LRSRSAWSWLLEKEARELLAARSFWILLAAMGPLVGFCFIGAVRSYAEVSAGGGGAVLSPLVGVWGPTFGACELAAALLFPFVVIRLVAGDRLTGASKLELQHPMPAAARLAAKAIVLLGGWSLALLAPAAAIASWRAWGGSIFVPELLAVVAGHFLNAGLAVGLAAAAATLAEHPATAAILTLCVTVGSWVVQLAAAIHGGWWEAVARYTPAAMVAELQHGLVRLRVVLVALVLTAFGLAVAALWMRIGLTWKRRAAESAVAAVAASALVLVGSRARASWDLSEDRASSWSRADEAALRTIAGTLRVEAHLAPEDPRRGDLEPALAKLERVLPHLDARFVSATTSGLFEQSAEGYGEIRYELDGRRLTGRSTTPEGVLEAVYALARIAPPALADLPFRGRPLAAAPVGAGWIFYGAWPAAVAILALVTTRRTT
jgi:hypothetical protein